MRFGLISDIHGNLEALEAVLKELDTLAVDEILCLGDIIGYGPDPEQCVQRVREHAKIILAGNHDYAPIGLVDTTYFNPYAKKAVAWTGERLSQDVREFLKQRPLKIDVDDFTIVHATPAEPDAWEYILSVDDAIANFPHFQTQVCFIGHSHVHEPRSAQLSARYRLMALMVPTPSSLSNRLQSACSSTISSRQISCDDMNLTIVRWFLQAVSRASRNAIENPFSASSKIDSITPPSPPFLAQTLILNSNSSNLMCCRLHKQWLCCVH